MKTLASPRYRALGSGLGHGRRGVVASILVAVLSSACGGSNAAPAPSPTVTVVTVSGTGASAVVGQTAALVATANFSNGSASNVTAQAIWTTSNTAMATVSPTGSVTFVGVGDVDVKATFQNVTGSVHVTVGAQAPTVTAVVVTGIGSTATVGQNAALIAMATLSNGTTSDVTGQATWDSSNAGIATVSSTGAASFVGAGDVDLRATFRGVVGSTHVTVAPRVTPPDISAFYGTFIVTLTVTAQQCSVPVTPDPTGTLTMSGQPDGSGFSAKITERGVSRTYTGRINANGTFSGSLPPGTLLPGAAERSRPLHEVSGTIQGTASGTAVSGTETLTYSLGCSSPPPNFIDVSFSGNK